MEKAKLLLLVRMQNHEQHALQPRCNNESAYIYTYTYTYIHILDCTGCDHLTHVAATALLVVLASEILWV